MRRWPVLAVVGVLLIGACGNDDGADVRSTGSGSNASASSAGSASGENAEEAPVELEGTVNNHGAGEVEDGAAEVELDDFYFGPTFLRAEPGEEVVLTVFNEGDADHTFTSDALDVDETLAPGDEVEVTITMPDEGAVRYYCRFHADRGMQGALYSQAGDTVVDAGSSGGSGGGGDIYN